MKDGRTKNSLRNIFFGVGMKISILLITFIIRTIIVRELGADYAGLNSLFTSILNFLNLSELGFGSALVYMMYEPVAKSDNIKIGQLLNLYRMIYKVIGIVVLIIGLIFMTFLSKFINGECPSDVNLYYLYIIFLINTVISYFMFAYRSSLFVAFQRTDIQSKIMMIVYFSTSILQIAVLIIFKNYYIYALLNPVYTIAQNILLGFLSRKYFPSIICKGHVSRSELNGLFSKTIALTGHKIGGTIISSLDSIVISSIMGLVAVGMYGNYFTILSSLMGFINVGMQAILPSIGNYLINTSDKDKYVMFMRLNFINTWIVGWCSVCLLCLLQPFVKLWLGDNMLLTKVEMIWFCLYFYSWQFRTLGCNYKDAAGIWTEDIAKPYIASIINVILNIILVKRIGISGALISTVICMVSVYFPWETIVLFKKLFHRNAKEYVLFQSVTFIQWLLIALVSYFLCMKIDIDGIGRLIVNLLICIIIPNIIYCLLNFKRNEYKDTLRMLCKNIDRKINFKG